MGNCYDDTEFGEYEDDDELEYFEDEEETEFGRRRRRGRPRKRRRMVKGRRFIMVRGRKRKLYRGKNGALFYRTRSGKTYIKGRRRSRFGEKMGPVEYTDMEFGARLGRSRFGEKMGPVEYTDMEFGARLASTKILKVLQEIADNISPDFKYSSQIGKNGRQKLLTVNALKRKLTKSNYDWKRMVELATKTDPRYIPTRGQKFKGGFKYLKMVANRWFGFDFKYSDKIDKKGRPKLLTESALKKKLSAALKHLNKDWRDEANTTRAIVLEIYKNLKSSFQNSGMKKTNATKLANKIMKDNEDGISMGPQLWYEMYKADVQRDGKSPELAAWDTTSSLIRTPPLADVAALPRVPIGKGGRQSGYEEFVPLRSMSMNKNRNLDDNRKLFTRSSDVAVAAPSGIGYRAFVDDMIEAGIRPGTEEWERREEAWARTARANSYNPPTAAAIGTMLPPLRNDGVSLPVGGPGGGNPFNNDLSERLLGFGYNCNQRSARKTR